MLLSRRPVSSQEFTSVDEIGRTSASVFGSDPAGDRMRLLRVDTAWGRAVGAHLRTISRPASFTSGRLAIEVADQTWKKELDHLAPSILARLAQVMPAEPVAEISFRVRRSGTPAGPAVFRKAGETGSGADGNRRAAWGVVELLDGDLQHRLTTVMGRYLARAERTAASR